MLLFVHQLGTFLVLKDEKCFPSYPASIVLCGVRGHPVCGQRSQSCVMQSQLVCDRRADQLGGMADVMLGIEAQS